MRFAHVDFVYQSAVHTMRLLRWQDGDQVELSDVDLAAFAAWDHMSEEDRNDPPSSGILTHLRLISVGHHGSEDYQNPVTVAKLSVSLDEVLAILALPSSELETKFHRLRSEPGIDNDGGDWTNS